MSGVINDIDALAEFRAHLMQFNRDLAENFATIRGHWRELGEVWRDDMYRLFGEALDEVTPGIAHVPVGHRRPRGASGRPDRTAPRLPRDGPGSGRGAGAGTRRAEPDRGPAT